MWQGMLRVEGIIHYLEDKSEYKVGSMSINSITLKTKGECHDSKRQKAKDKGSNILAKKV